MVNPLKNCLPESDGLYVTNQLPSLPFFLLRPRKRAKKKGACLPSRLRPVCRSNGTGRRRQAARRLSACVRQHAQAGGAGFSVNQLTAVVGNWLPCYRIRPSQAMVLDGIARKNPPHHNRTLQTSSRRFVRLCSYAISRLQSPHSATGLPPIPLPERRRNYHRLVDACLFSPSPHRRGGLPAGGFSAGRGERSAAAMALPLHGADAGFAFRFLSLLQADCLLLVCLSLCLCVFV